MSGLSDIKHNIKCHNYTVGVVGLGYVGLPLLLRFGEAGFKVLGFDIDSEKVKSLNFGVSYISHIADDRVLALASTESFESTADFNRLVEADAIIICVPTPLTRYREPDLQFVVNTAEVIALKLRPGQLVVLESTTYPGTTEEVLLPLFESRGYKVGKDFFLAFSPEREDPGNRQYTISTVPKVVGGVTSNCRELACVLYSQVIKRVVPVSSTRVAEASKLLENIYRSVNVALVNELKMAFDRMNIDIWEVIDAASTKPFGFQPFYPGPGLGGHCIPIDPFYLTWKAREYGITTRFIELAGEINHAMPAYVVQKLADALNTCGKAMRGAKVLVMGVSYKKDVGDLRESPSLEIIEILLAKGVNVDYSDPYYPRLPTVRRHSLEMESVLLSEELIRQYDAIVVATDHNDFPYEMIHKSARLIVDSRNALRKRGLCGDHITGA